MTTTKKLQPKPIRKVNTMTESPKVVITKQRDFTHKEPVIIPSHYNEIPVISAASYIKDARNRWYIHSEEVKELWDQHVDIFNRVKPHVVSAYNYTVSQVKKVTKRDE
tara:strand:- start:139 stop:462 length:324 start_codon:yes stop_codon:yes gene_type:complete